MSRGHTPPGSLCVILYLHLTNNGEAAKLCRMFRNACRALRSTRPLRAYFPSSAAAAGGGAGAVVSLAWKSWAVLLPPCGARNSE